MPVTDRDKLLTQLLRSVSRSFYLTLRVLPSKLRQPVGLAYLLARAADTIADTRLLPPDQRLKYLLAFRAQIAGPTSRQALDEIAGALSDKQSNPAERALLETLPKAFSVLEGLAEEDRARVRCIVTKLTQGMEIDLTTFPPGESGEIAALNDAEDLDRYIYLVAGCVGEFWTETAKAHTDKLNHWDTEKMSEIGVRFGKALQLTNVLRDVPKDLRIGRCYLPWADLELVGLSPEQLLEPSSGVRAMSVLKSRIETALEHYTAAEEYLLAIPRRCPRLRLAALWPILIGLATLDRLVRNKDWLDPSKPSRVTRGWVYRTVALSVPAVFSDSLLRMWIHRLRRHVSA